ncbi:MAG: hypothetical protein H0X63_11805 [Flavobacteriales bacterium]|nr:hypothetical protein [Flavobacteriales bacterium]
MDTIQIRQKLHKLIEDAGQEKLEAFYEALCSIDKPAVFWWEDKNVLRELDSRIESWVEEKEAVYTLEDIDREIAIRKSELKK